MVSKQEQENENFFKEFQSLGHRVAEGKQKELDKRRQRFLKLIEGRDEWKLRVSLSATDILVISRVLCRSLSLDDVLQKQLYAIFSCKEEKNLVTAVLHKLLLSFRMSSSHREDMVTHPNYIDPKWHGGGLDILHGIKEAFDVSYKYVDAQRLEQDHIYDIIGEEQYRKNARKVVEDMLRKQEEKDVK